MGFARERWTCPSGKIMKLRTYQYASLRVGGEGLRIGTARFLPRGVRKGDWQAKGYFDFWLPVLAPEPEAIKAFLGGTMSWAVFARRYRSRMKQRDCRQMIEFLGGVSLFVPLSLGCYCDNESRCHRSVLKELVAVEARKRETGFLALCAGSEEAERLRFASPVCYAGEVGEE